MAVLQPSPREIFEACRVLFGPGVQVSPEFLRYLHPVGLKSAFRRRALETHPDRARALGIVEKELQHRFQTVRRAYDILETFLKTQKRVYAAPGHTQPFRRTAQPGKRPQPHGWAPPRPSGTRRRTRTDHFYQGGLPRRMLLFGQYLYYAGVISWRTLIDAITWQRLQRPRIGQIAMGWGLLTSRDIVRILTERTLNERFGECALRTGHITQFQHIALIGRQRKLQRPIGEYFVAHGHLSGGQVLHFVSRQRAHNRNAMRCR